MDYYDPACGYPTIVAIWDNRTDALAASWFTGPRGVDAALDTPYECQLLCQSMPECAYFAFELEATRVPEAICYLKAAYSDVSCGYSALPHALSPHAAAGSCRSRGGVLERVGRDVCGGVGC